MIQTQLTKSELAWNMHLPKKPDSGACVWNIWTDVEAATVHADITADHRVVRASIFMSIFWDGMWLTQEPPCRFQTTCFQFSRFARFSQSVKVGTIWLSWKRRVAFHLISSSSGYGNGNLLILLGSFHRPIPVRYNWSVFKIFARKMHLTSEFAVIVLSKCVGVCVCITHVYVLRASAIFKLFASFCASWMFDFSETICLFDGSAF